MWSMDFSLTVVKPVRVFFKALTADPRPLAKAAGIEQALCQPITLGITKAAQLTPHLKAGLAALKAEPTRFEEISGFHAYVDFVVFIEGYLAKCEANPTAAVFVS